MKPPDDIPIPEEPSPPSRESKRDVPQRSNVPNVNKRKRPKLSRKEKARRRNVRRKGR